MVRRTSNILFVFKWRQVARDLIARVTGKVKMSKLNANTYLLKAISALTIVLTGFGGFASQAAQAIEQSCDIDNSSTLIGCDFQGLDISGRTLSNRVIV
ncbi:MAG: hypothetical protein EBT65_06555, partial [Actinobacteria bacterium]|nr:hypothetical protein [Actinomycetota bacterium]